MLRALLWFCLLFGLLTFAVCFFYALLDWEQLQLTNERFIALARQPSAAENALFVAEARQNAHRINIFAEGVWALQGLILAAIAAIGLNKSKRTKVASSSINV